MTRHRLLGASFVLGVGLGLLPLVRAQDRPDEKKAITDARFVVGASASGHAEVQFGRLALMRSTNPDIKRFAQTMVEDHSRANRELATLANDKRLDLARAMDRDHQVKFDKLAQMRGEQFDRAYAEGQVKDHEDAVALFEDEAKNGADTQLKAWASRTLPHLKDHLKMAHSLGGKGAASDR